MADLQGLQIRPVLEAEGIAKLPPGHELIKELAGAIAAVAEAVPRNLEGRDHPIMMVRCTQQSWVVVCSAHVFRSGTVHKPKSQQPLAGLCCSTPCFHSLASLRTA